MNSMFNSSPFNGDISNWNVGNLEMAYRVFEQSRFNGDISNWDVSNVSNMEMMFNRSPFNGDISNWDVSNVSEMARMFEMSPFNGDLTHWNVKSLIDKAHKQFDNSPLKGKEPWWYCFLRVFYSAELMMDSLDWNWIDLENKIIWRSRLIYTLNKRKNEKWNGKFPKVWGFTYK